MRSRMMAPLQVAVFWRLSLIFFFNSFLFFLDGFAASRGPCAKKDPLSLSVVAAGGPPDSPRGNDSSLTRAGLLLLGVMGNDTSLRLNGSGRADGNDATLHDCHWLSYGQTLYMIGLLLGSLFTGAISDRYGKRPVLLVSVCVHAVCGVVPAALHLSIVYLAVRCLTGVCCCCINMCSFSLAVEWSVSRHRVWPPALLSFSFSLGMMSLCPLVYITSTWTQLHLILGLPQVLCLPLYICLPESPRWLFLKNRTDVLDKYRNHSPDDTRCLEQLLDTGWSDVKATNQKAKMVTEPRPPADPAPSDLSQLRQPIILLRLFIMSFLSFVSALTYFGICLNVGSFGVDAYLAQFFSGLSEAPCLLVPLLLARCGRRPITMLALSLSGFACLLSLLVSQLYDVPVLVITLALLGKFCMLITVLVCVLYSIELFPTGVRQTCVGVVSLCFRVGCILNTFISPNGRIPLAAMVLYGGGPMLGSALCLLLPETSGMPLPDSLDDCGKQPKLRLPRLPATWTTWHVTDGPHQSSDSAVLPEDKDPAAKAVTHTAYTHTECTCTCTCTCTHPACTNAHTDTSCAETHTPPHAHTPHTDAPCTETHTPPHAHTDAPCTETHTPFLCTNTPQTVKHRLPLDTGVV